MDYLAYSTTLTTRLFNSIFNRGGHIMCHSNKKYLLELFFILQKHINFQQKLLMDLVGIDYPFNKKRFQLVYNCLSIVYGIRFFIKLNISSLESVPSVTCHYPSVSWYEREAWDLFGIHFINNTDLRRILTDYGFSGHPLRKDFPLTGYTEVVFSEKIKNIIYKPVSLVQDLRTYDTLMPWNFFWHFEKPSSQ